MVDSLIAWLQISFTAHIMLKILLKISLPHFVYFFKNIPLYGYLFVQNIVSGYPVMSSLFYTFVLMYYLLWCSSLILLSGDIKTIPAPISSSGKCLLICHSNLNCIRTHTYVKWSLLTLYNLVHSFDIIGLLETYLCSETPSNDTRLELPGSALIRSALWPLFQ